jgi:hypothetical protein
MPITLELSRSKKTLIKPQVQLARKALTAPFQLNLQQTTKAIRVSVQTFQMGARAITDFQHRPRELAEQVFVVLMALMEAPSTLPLPPQATLTSITSPPKVDGVAKVDQVAMVDFLPAAEGADLVGLVILAPASFSRAGVAGVVQADRAAKAALVVRAGLVRTVAKAAPLISHIPVTGRLIGLPM